MDCSDRYAKFVPKKVPGSSQRLQVEQPDSEKKVLFALAGSVLPADVPLVLRAECLLLGMFYWSFKTWITIQERKLSQILAELIGHSTTESTTFDYFSGSDLWSFARSILNTLPRVDWLLNRRVHDFPTFRAFVQDVK
jgi:hypothetical protein